MSFSYIGKIKRKITGEAIEEKEKEKSHHQLVPKLLNYLKKENL